MSIKINSEKCVGCGRCALVCPGSLIKRGADGKAYIKYPRDCWGCASCLKECPARAVEFYLGSDVGGMGSVMHTENNGDILTWVIERYDGVTEKIDIDRRESNKY